MSGLTNFTAFEMAVIVGIDSRCGLAIEAHHRNQPDKCTLMLYNPLLSL